MIELADICKTFKLGDQAVHALRDVSLTIGAGEYVSVMGPSGSGKSTLLNLIALLDRPTSGSYRLDDEDVTDLDDDRLALTRREKIGFVFQFFHLIPRLTAAQNIEVPLVLAGTSPAERKTRLERVLSDYGLLERADHRPDQLSGGQRQRVAIARATIMGPALLLADEPTGNLDTTSGHEIVSLLEALNEKGMTLLIVTHDPDLGQRARRRIRIVDGRIAGDENRNAGD